MMEALSSSETSILTRATRRNIPEDGILQSHFGRQEFGATAEVCLVSLLRAVLAMSPLLPPVTWRDDINMSFCKVTVQDHKSQRGVERGEFGLTLCYRAVAEGGWSVGNLAGFEGGGSIQRNYVEARSSQGHTQSVC
jgi:hypothetical protein